jgi:predicted Zn-dependent protease
LDKARFDEAIRCLKAGKLGEGKEILEKLVVDEPRNSTLLYNLGVCYSDLNDLTAAVRMLRQCLEQEPNRVDAMTALGVAYARSGDYDAAERFVKQAIGHDPENSFALRNFGAIFLQKQEFEKALYYLRRSFEMLPDDYQTVYGLAQACRHLGDMKNADEYLGRLLAMEAPEELKKTARRERSQIAEELFKAGGFRADAMLYCLSALEFYEGKSFEEIQKTAFEIALLGRSGFDLNNLEKKYSCKAMPGKFSALQMICFMYVGFQKVAPSQDLRFDLDEEYAGALRLFQAKKDLK